MKTPFYRLCYCVKASGGKRPLWHARLNAEGFAIFGMKNLVKASYDTRSEGWRYGYMGAGKNGDLAIADLQKQMSLLKNSKAP